jgi:hypothetical protein
MTATTPVSTPISDPITGTNISASPHRTFVTLNCGDGAEVWITPASALTLARQLLDAADVALDRLDAAVAGWSKRA